MVDSESGKVWEIVPRDLSCICLLDAYG